MKIRILHLVIVLGLGLSLNAQNPCLIITKENSLELKEAVNKYPLWKTRVEHLSNEIDLKIKNPIDVPVPVDPAGGYTHTQHKQNGKLLKQLGILYQVTGDIMYATYAKNMFLAYAQLFPTLGVHPVKKSYAPGKLFWQQLNDAVWVTDAIQGYDCIVETLSDKEKSKIEKDLLLPYADFLSVENPRVFNRIHNHGVWACAAVGMTGLALQNDELVYRAFFGINEKGKPNKTKVNPEEFETLKVGFFAQTAKLFSPEGYYTEGPYYQRYAMTPFLLFAQSISNNVKEADILNFRNQIFFKAVETLVDLTDSEGKYFPINDYLQGMSLYAPESVEAVTFLYAKTKNPELLSLLKKSDINIINYSGLEVVKGLESGIDEPLKSKSKLITDGNDGKAGGIALMRENHKGFCYIFKYASHGLTHGHFDRLNLFGYYGANEILTDYGAARFVNIKAKEGGRYLPENKSYAKQTIAHNTLVINEKSHFNYKYKVASKYNPTLIFGDIENPKKQVVCASETNAYPGVNMTRLIAVIDDEAFVNPILVDIFNVSGDTIKETFDLPYHFKGQLMSTDFEYTANSSVQKTFGKAYGYQHLWVTAQGKSNNSQASFTWLNNHNFYSLTTVVDTTSELFFTKIGASDPNFNLRNEPAFIIRDKGLKNRTYGSVIECHGYQNPTTEIVSNQTKQVQNVKLHNVEAPYVAFEFNTVKGDKFILVANIGEDQSKTHHKLKINNETIEWDGSYKLLKQ